MKRLLGTGASAVFLLLLSACNGSHNQTNIELITNMMDQPSIKSQDWVPAEGDKGQMRMPPAHTVARNRPPYPFTNDPDQGDKEVNPLHGDMSPETLKVGHHYYEIYCSICHGTTGAGNGSVSVVMALKPRNLLSPEAKAYSDGRINYAMSSGRGAMRSYISQIPDQTVRWKIVNYIRSLQK